MSPIVIAILLSCSGLGGAQAADIDRGRELFLGHCAACHGPDADGRGPMSPLITLQVPDLTQIAARNGGAFPMADVVQIIDGRTALRGHGGPMLVYGQILGGGSAAVDGPGNSTIQTRGEIVDLAAYLATMQKP